MENLETLRDPTMQQPLLRWRYRLRTAASRTRSSEKSYPGCHPGDPCPPVAVASSETSSSLRSRSRHEPASALTPSRRAAVGPSRPRTCRPQREQQPGDLGVACQLLASRRCGDQQRRPIRSTEQERQPAVVVVAPVQSSAPGTLARQRGFPEQGLEESVPAPGVDHRREAAMGSEAASASRRKSRPPHQE